MLIGPLDDLEGRWLGHAFKDRHRPQERHMEFLAVLGLGHQACENDQLDHLPDSCITVAAALSLRDHGGA
jgi:hypothetical protein